MALLNLWHLQDGLNESLLTEEWLAAVRTKDSPRLVYLRLRMCSQCAVPTSHYVASLLPCVPLNLYNRASFPDVLESPSAREDVLDALTSRGIPKTGSGQSIRARSRRGRRYLLSDGE